MKRRPSAPVVIACVALFFSLGGAGLAASRYVVTSASQIAPSARHALVTSGVFRVTSVRTACARGSACAYQTITAACPSKSTVLAGGFETVPIPTPITLLADAPDTQSNSNWIISVHNDGSRSVDIQAFAICVR